MRAKRRDYSIFEDFQFERKPVGVKFLPLKPAGIERLDKMLDTKLNFCEMLKEAQVSPPFYVDREYFQCIEPMLLGMEDPDAIFVSGLVGDREGIYEEARANRGIYQYLPMLPRGSVKYAAFSSLDEMSFEPDVLVVTANVSQAQVLLRAMGYATGEVWSSKGTPVAACAWIYIYPIISGKLNFTVTGLSLGMQSLKVFPEGLFLISIPWHLLLVMMDNLRNMNWSYTSPTETRDENRMRMDKLFEDLKKEMDQG